MVKHILWFIGGFVSVMVCVTFMALVLTSTHHISSGWFVPWFPILVPAVISIFAWRKSPGYAIGVALWAVYLMIVLLQRVH